jgi:hypothetical protein
MVAVAWSIIDLHTIIFNLGIRRGDSGEKIRCYIFLLVQASQTNYKLLSKTIIVLVTTKLRPLFSIQQQTKRENWNPTAVVLWLVIIDQTILINVEISGIFRWKNLLNTSTVLKPTSTNFCPTKQSSSTNNKTSTVIILVAPRMDEETKKRKIEIEL